MINVLDVIPWLKKNINKRDLLLIGLILLIFIFTRFINLDKFPIFSDEGIYIHWAKVAWHDAAWRFVSLTDGKQPLQTWGTIPFLKLFPTNALLAGRLFSVVTGLVGLAGMSTLLYYLFGKKTSIVGSFIYVLTPYFLFYDKLALVDSGVNAGFIWVLFLSILLARTRRLDVALIFGLVAGITLLAKSSARLFIGLSLLAPLLLWEKNKNRLLKNSLNYYVLFAIGGLISLILYNVQRLSPFFHYVAEKNKTFVMTFSEFRHDPFSVVAHNLQIIPEYVINESGFVLVIFTALGLWKLFKKDKNLALYLTSWLVLPFLAIAFFSKVIYPRYLIFFASLFVIFASYFIGQLKNKKHFIVSMSFIIGVFLLYNYTTLFNYAMIPFPEIDRGQYIEGVTVGVGAKEIVEYARAKSQEKPVLLLAEGSFGLVGDVLDVFTWQNDKINIKGYWPLGEKELLENQKELGKNYVYVVFAQKKEFPQEWPIKLIKQFEKPDNKSTIYLFELQK